MQYITQAEYRRQKSALTRAVNSGDRDAIIRTVKRTVAEWDGKAWPDDWSRWDRALLDATRGAIGIDNL